MSWNPESRYIAMARAALSSSSCSIRGVESVAALLKDTVEQCARIVEDNCHDKLVAIVLAEMIRKDWYK